MKSTIKFLLIGVLTLGTVSCTNNDQAETEKLYIDSPDGNDETKDKERDGDS